MEKTRKIYRGLSKASFTNQKEYSFTEAQEILGPCIRKKLTYIEQKEIWKAITSAYNPKDLTRCIWTNKGTPKILEEFDVWVNERGDMLLAIPLPENTLNINDFKL